MKEQYRNTEEKDDKTDLSRSIVDRVYEYGGRFVKKDAGSDRYYILSKSEARIKTSQALRENRDSKGVSSDSDPESDSESAATKVATPKKLNGFAMGGRNRLAMSLGLDTASLDCVEALVSLSRTRTPSVLPKAA